MRLGRFLVPLADEGVDIDGVDASAEMLDACRERCSALTNAPALAQQLLQDLDLPRRYGAIFVGGGGSFGLIADRDEAVQALKRLHDHLEPGGRLGVEVQTPHAAQGVASGRVRMRSWVRSDGGRIVLTETGTYDNEQRVIEGIGIYQLFVNGRLVETELDEFPCRLWDRDELASVLCDVGFTDVDCTKGFSNTPIDGTEWLLSFACTRS